MVCQTKPIRRCGRTCETKPIGQGIGFRGSGVSDLTTQARARSAELPCETNPIGARTPGAVSAGKKGRYEEWHATRAKKKQSQIAEEVEEVGRDAQPTKSRRAKQSQFVDCGFRIADCGLNAEVAAAPPGRPWSSCTNKPNWLPARLCRVKQSQSPVLCRSGDRRSRGDEASETKPIRAGRGLGLNR